MHVAVAVAIRDYRSCSVLPLIFVLYFRCNCYSTAIFPFLLGSYCTYCTVCTAALRPSCDALFVLACSDHRSYYGSTYVQCTSTVLSVEEEE